MRCGVRAADGVQSLQKVNVFNSIGLKQKFKGPFLTFLCVIQ